MPMRDYEDLKNLKIPAEQERIMDITMNIMLDKGAYMPTRAHKTDAGLDLYAKSDTHVIVPVGGSAVFDTGVHVEIPTGWAGLVKSKSGLNVKHGILSDGVVDCGYSGSIVVKLYNHGEHAVTITGGMKISQLVLVDSMPDSERGNNGFGSTGA